MRLRDLPRMKIVSLLPSATEIVYALGLGDDLIGVTDECDYPPDAVTKPVVSRSALPQGRPLSSREIDEAVRGAHGRARAPLHPGHGAAPPRAARRDPHPGPLPGLRGAERPGAAGAGRARACRTRRCCRSIRTRSRRSSRRSRPSASCSAAPSAARRSPDLLRSRVARVKEIAHAAADDPGVLPRLVGPAVRGGALDAGDGGGRRRRQPAEREGRAVDRSSRGGEIRDENPEVIVFMPCGYYLEEAEEEGAALFDHPDFADTPAARNGNVFAVDATSFFSRPGPADRGRPGDHGVGGPPRGLSRAAARVHHPPEVSEPRAATDAEAAVRRRSVMTTSAGTHLGAFTPLDWAMFLSIGLHLGIVVPAHRDRAGCVRTRAHHVAPDRPRRGGAVAGPRRSAAAGPGGFPSLVAFRCCGSRSPSRSSRSPSSGSPRA